MRPARGLAVVTFAEADLSGAPRMGLAVAEALVADGWRVTAFCPPGGPTGGVAQKLASCGIAVREVAALAAESRWPDLAAWIVELGKLRPDIVISLFLRDSKITGLITPLLGAKVVISFQNQIRFFGSGLVRRLKELGLLAVVHNSGVTGVATSASIAAVLSRRYRCPPRDVVTIYNGAETAKMAPDTALVASRRRQWAISERSILFACVGRIDPQKGQLECVDAFIELIREGRDVVLLLAGAPSTERESMEYDARLRTRIQESGCGQRIRLLGWRTDVPQVLHACDCFVQASWWEGFSLAPLEAMAQEIPVILTGSAGLPPGFQHGVHGVAVETPAVLLGGLRTFLSFDAQARRTVAQNGRELVCRNFSRESCTEKYVAICRHHVSSKVV